MAIPNPNPNIADGIKCDNKTYSSNKIESLITAATEIPVPGAGDAGKVLSVNSDEDGYELSSPVTEEDVNTIAETVMTEETSGTVTAGTDIVLRSSSLKKVGCIAQLVINVDATTTASLARWGNYTIGSVDIVPKYEIYGLTKIKLGSDDWFDVAYTIDTTGNVIVYDTYGVTAGTITGLKMTALYITE